MNTKILHVDPSSILFNKDEGIETCTPIFTDPKTKSYLDEASIILRSHKNCIGFPTETVYGLGASSLNDESVKSIYIAKNRPLDNPLITHVASLSQLHRKILPPSTKIPDIYLPLIKKFWPGPLTIFLPVEDDTTLSRLTTAGQDTFAVRIPNHPVARALIAISDEPLAAPSANASTRPSPTLAEHVYHDLQGRIPLIIDGGPSNVGLESSVVNGLTNPPMLLRPGGISLKQIQEVGHGWEDIVTAKKTANASEPVRTPGMKYKHYSPTAKVILFVKCGNGVKAVQEALSRYPNSKIALLTGSEFEIPETLQAQFAIVDHLGSSITEMAHNLFAKLRNLDKNDMDYIFIEGVPDAGEGLALMNRLSKAAHETISNDSK